MRAEIIRRDLERFLPTRDPVGQRTVDILEGLFRGRVAGLANPVKDASRDDLLLRFIAEESVLEGHVLVRRIQAHGFPELVARTFVVADFQQRIGQILADGCAIGR